MLQTLLLTLSLALFFMPQQAPETAAKFSRAVELQQQGKLKEAADEYRAVLKLKPDYAEAHANLGAVLARLGNYDEAMTSYQKALQINPGLTPIWLNLGILHYRASQFVKTVETLEKFLASQPGHVQARQLSGLALLELGRDEQAIAALEPTLEASGQDAAVLYSLGLAYLRMRRPEVRSMIGQLAAFPAGRAASQLLEGQTLLANFEFEKAIAELSEARKLNPDLPRLHYSLGLSYFKLGRNQEAIAAFEQELRRRPQDFASLYYLANLHEAGGNLDQAHQYLDAALKLDAGSPEANALLGKILFKQNRAAEALKPLELAVAKDATDADKRYLLARVYQQLGRREDAAREFAEVQRLKAEQLKKDRANTPKP
jgi:tetratricopeptide (TPR) repeat protein